MIATTMTRLVGAASRTVTFDPACDRQRRLRSRGNIERVDLAQQPLEHNKVNNLALRLHPHGGAATMASTSSQRRPKVMASLREPLVR
jgi:hypothetical protein